MTSIRRILCTIFLLSISLGSFTVSAHADSTGQSICDPDRNTCESLGDRYRNLGGSDNGTRAYIAGSGHPNSIGEVLAYVAVQTDYGTSEGTLFGTAGLVEIGESVRDFGADACTSGGVATIAFFAYRISGQNSIHCPYHAAISTFGSGGLFDVVYQNGAWHANRNGNEVGTVSSLGFTSGWSVASDVVFVAKGALEPAEAINFGPHGNNPWQFTTNNGSTYSNIQTSLVDQNTDTDDDSDGDWYLQGTPSPFDINWTGY